MSSPTAPPEIGAFKAAASGRPLSPEYFADILRSLQPAADSQTCSIPPELHPVVRRLAFEEKLNASEIARRLKDEHECKTTRFSVGRLVRALTYVDAAKTQAGCLLERARIEGHVAFDTRREREDELDDIHETAEHHINTLAFEKAGLTIRLSHVVKKKIDLCDRSITWALRQERDALRAQHAAEVRERRMQNPRPGAPVDQQVTAPPASTDPEPRPSEVRPEPPPTPSVIPSGASPAPATTQPLSPWATAPGRGTIYVLPFLLFFGWALRAGATVPGNDVLNSPETPLVRGCAGCLTDFRGSGRVARAPHRALTGGPRKPLARHSEPRPRALFGRSAGLTGTPLARALPGGTSDGFSCEGTSPATETSEVDGASAERVIE